MLKQLRKIFAPFNRNDKEIEVIHFTSNQWRTERPSSGGVVIDFTDRLLNVSELPTNGDQLPASDHRKASIYQQAVELGPVYTIPFSYENGMEMLSYENCIM